MYWRWDRLSSPGGIGLFVIVVERDSPLPLQLRASRERERQRERERPARAASSGRTEDAIAEVGREQREDCERVPDALQQREVLASANL